MHPAPASSLGPATPPRKCGTAGAGDPRAEPGATEEFPAASWPALARREPLALARFFDCYFPRVHRYIQRLVGEAHCAEDLAQDVFVQIQRHLDGYDSRRDPGPWVFAIATNRVRMHWRARRSRPDAGAARLDGSEWRERLPVEGEGPAEAAPRAEDARRLRALVAELPPATRALVLLRVHEELPFAAIGEVLRITPATARKRYSRALARLRAAFDDAAPASAALRARPARRARRPRGADVPCAGREDGA